MKKKRNKFPKFELGVGFKEFALEPVMQKSLFKQTRKEKNIIFGARSIKKQIGIYGRHTEDWDILSKTPKKSALKTEKKFDNIFGSNQYYTKPALHPGTYKVMSKGMDRRKGTTDDYGVVDYSKMPKPKPKTVKINGVSYRKLSKEKKAKYTSLNDKTQAFRHQKDRDDLERIKLATGKKR